MRLVVLWDTSACNFNAVILNQPIFKVHLFIDTVCSIYDLLLCVICATERKAWFNITRVLILINVQV